MTPEKCPGCGAKLRPDMTACPNCPMSFPEDDAPTGIGYSFKQSRYHLLISAVLFLGAVGAAVWYLSTGLLRLGMANNQLEKGNLYGEKTTAAVPASASGGNAQLSEPKPADDEGLVVLTRAGKAPTEWKLRGAVYDLATLKPLTGCEILFTDEGENRSIRTRTDSSGRYRALVPPASGGNGYSVSIKKEGYSRHYLDSGTENVREMDDGQRLKMARDLSTTLMAQPAAVQSESEKPLVTDFYLAPRP